MFFFSIAFKRFFLLYPVLNSGTVECEGSDVIECMAFRASCEFMIDSDTLGLAKAGRTGL